MRVGIYGGSFNPVHRGHTALANAVCRLGIVDEVWLMVSPLNPFKQGQQSHILPEWQRLKLARIATAPFPHLRVSDLECSMPRPSYTVTTLERLEAIFPTIQFSLLMGEDNWQGFDGWYRADYIRSHHDLIVYQRTADERSTLATVTVHRTDGSAQTLTSPHLHLYPISSTQIRQAIHEGNDTFLRQWLHGGVLNYIRRHGLYA